MQAELCLKIARPRAPSSLQRPQQPFRGRIRVLAFKSSTYGEKEIRPGVFEGSWQWRGHRIRYHRSGDDGPPILLAHGFCASADCWRNNIGPLARAGHRVWAVDLLGFGYSDKPSPKSAPPRSLYSIESWGQQLADFLEDEVGSRAVLVANSAGGVQLIDVSLRRLHNRRQGPLARAAIGALQWVLHETPLGRVFYGRVARQGAVKQLLLQAYGREEAVTEELVDLTLAPGLLPGAADVFLETIADSNGPLPEELIEQVTVPVSILWGASDTWEDPSRARALLAHLPAVEEFIELPGCGHVPQDEAPELVNPLITAFVARCQSQQPSVESAAAPAADSTIPITTGSDQFVSGQKV